MYAHIHVLYLHIIPSINEYTHTYILSMYIHIHVCTHIHVNMSHTCEYVNTYTYHDTSHIQHDTFNMYEPCE